MNKWLNFGGDLNHCWKLRKVVNGHKSAAHIDWPEAVLIRRVLAEVCAVPVLQIMIVIIIVLYFKHFYFKFQV